MFRRIVIRSVGSSLVVVGGRVIKPLTLLLLPAFVATEDHFTTLDLVRRDFVEIILSSTLRDGRLAIIRRLITLHPASRLAEGLLPVGSNPLVITILWTVRKQVIWIAAVETPLDTRLDCMERDLLARCVNPQSLPGHFKIQTSSRIKQTKKLGGNRLLIGLFNSRERLVQARSDGIQSLIQEHPLKHLRKVLHRAQNHSREDLTNHLKSQTAKLTELINDRLEASLNPSEVLTSHFERTLNAEGLDCRLESSSKRTITPVDNSQNNPEESDTTLGPNIEELVKLLLCSVEEIMRNTVLEVDKEHPGAISINFANELAAIDQPLIELDPIDVDQAPICCKIEFTSTVVQDILRRRMIDGVASVSSGAWPQIRNMNQHTHIIVVGMFLNGVKRLANLVQHITSRSSFLDIPGFIVSSAPMRDSKFIRRLQIAFES
eukprot:scaffold14427_cov94-Skeletonema_dohrnii-CCMP3373.AAC.3